METKAGLVLHLQGNIFERQNEETFLSRTAQWLYITAGGGGAPFDFSGYLTHMPKELGTSKMTQAILSGHKKEEINDQIINEAPGHMKESSKLFYELQEPQDSREKGSQVLLRGRVTEKFPDLNRELNTDPRSFKLPENPPEEGSMERHDDRILKAQWRKSHKQPAL